MCGGLGRDLYAFRVGVGIFNGFERRGPASLAGGVSEPNVEGSILWRAALRDFFVLPASRLILNLA